MTTHPSRLVGPAKPMRNWLRVGEEAVVLPDIAHVIRQGTAPQHRTDVIHSCPCGVMVTGLDDLWVVIRSDAVGEERDAPG